MTISELLQVFLLILGAMLVFQAYWLAGTALFPRFVAQSRDHYKKPIRATLTGLAVVLPTFLIGFVVLGKGSNPVLNIIGYVIGSVPLILGVIGSSGLCQLIGVGLPVPGDQSQNWRRVWRGGLVLNFCYLLPFAGQVILCWAIISGCGALVLSFAGNKDQRTRGRNMPRTPRRSPVAEPLAKLDDDSPRSSRLQRSQIPSGDEGDKPKSRPRRPRRPSRPKQDE
ncbi:MAG: hypothetical protein VX704_05620 [Verrucomicrobiota bacterium]|nr:hypothetical protein [Verrucomicrobiota bacterium]